MRGRILCYSTLDIPTDPHRQFAFPEADLGAQHLSDISGIDKTSSLSEAEVAKSREVYDRCCSLRQQKDEPTGKALLSPRGIENISD
jgi:hypothetical protein